MFSQCHPEPRNKSGVNSAILVAKSKDLVQILLSLFLCAAMLVACGDDDCDSATRPLDDSASGVCEDCFKDDRDGHNYKMVKIGDQVWMAENLNFKTDSSFCYKNEEKYCAKYGRLYRWAEAVGKSESECGFGYKCSMPSGNIQGVCPSGWHLPSKDEWTALLTAVGGLSTAGKMLRSTFGWNRSGNGADDFGFSALSAGQRNIGGDFYDEGNGALFWGATEFGSDYAYRLYLYSDADDVHLGYFFKDYAFSVRCLKD